MVAEASLFSRYHTTQRKTHQIRKTTNTIPHHQVRNRISLRNHAKRVTVGAPNAWRKSRARRRLAANTALLAFDQRPEPCLASQCSVPFITKPAQYDAPCTHAHAAALAMGARGCNHRNTRKLALPHSIPNLPRRTLVDSDAPPPTPIAHHATRKKCARAGDAPPTTETHAPLSPSTRCGDANRRRGAAATEPTPSRKHALPPPPNRGNLNTAALANPQLSAVLPSHRRDEKAETRGEQPTIHATQMCPRRSHTPHHAPANRRHAANLSSTPPSAPPPLQRISPRPLRHSAWKGKEMVRLETAHNDCEQLQRGASAARRGADPSSQPLRSWAGPNSQCDAPACRSSWCTWTRGARIWRGPSRSHRRTHPRV